MSTNSENTKLKKLTNAWILKEFAGGPVLVWLAGLIYSIPILFLAFNLGGPSESMSQWGQFGDYVGGLINPLFGLITIILLVFTLKQNDLALQQAADELEETRAALLRGQAIQAATEQALRQQVAIAAAEKDFNSTLQLIAAFQDQIDEVNTVSKDTIRPTKEIATRLSATHDRLARRRRELLDLAELGYESLVERMLNENLQQKTLLAGVVCERFEFTVRYDLDEGHSTANFIDLLDRNIYSMAFEKLPAHQSVLMRRINSLHQAKEELTAAFKYFVDNGDWGRFNVVKVSSGKDRSE